MLNSRAQTFTLDYILGMSLFLIALAASLTLVVNIAPDNSARDLKEAALAISEDLLGEGFPQNWTSSSVLRLGLAANGALSEDKYSLLHTLNYTSTLGMFNTNYDYFVFFEDQNGNLITINGECGYGSEKVKYEKTHAFAYFFREDCTTNCDNVLIGLMMNQYNASIYYRDAAEGTTIPNDPGEIGEQYPGTLDGGFAEFLEALEHDSFDLAFLEDIHASEFLNTAELENFSTIVENWVAKGRTLYLTEHVKAHEMFSTCWPDSSGNAVNPANITEADVSLPFAAGESFDIGADRPPGPSLENMTDYKVIAEYSDGSTAILKFTWYDGAVYYFSNLYAAYQGKTNLSEEIEYSVEKTGARCQNLDISSIKYKNLMKIERLVPYRAQIIKMIVYVWEERH